MNAETVLTAVVTGVVTGVVSVVGGYFAVLHAMRQFKAQRSFDRQLEWHERTVRVLGTLSLLFMELADAEEPSSTISKIKPEVQKEIGDLKQYVYESVLYADQSSFEHLIRMSVKLRVFDDRQAFLEEEHKAIGNALSDALNDTLVELSQPVRKMLGLKEIALKPPK